MSKIFKKTVFAILIAGGLFSFAFPGLGICGTPALDELVAGIQKKYDSTSDFRARFVQEITMKTVRKTEREEGTVYFKKPKRMLWDYTRPEAKKLVINPKKSWLYVPQDNVVYIQDSRKIFNSRLTIKFLTGIGKIGDDFRIRYSDPETDEKGNFLLELSPRSPESGFDKLFVTVDRDTHMITKCRFRDHFGNTTIITFTGIKINNGFSDALFTFKPPQGVEIQNVP
ncbi:MAG: outer membrane lipoprotein carrier protein LolA [Syntrophales bacterium]|nr:outer membrane lipoprotein carrier protein LolA [Syntrophales bacterium]MDD5533539.1 outer membrane lipoprotein carrier protein LolA [Syntrophales bacterium]